MGKVLISMYDPVFILMMRKTIELALEEHKLADLQLFLVSDSYSNYQLLSL